MIDAPLSRRSVLAKSVTLAVFSFLPCAAARAAQLVAVRMWPADEYTRLTIEHDEPIKFRYFVMRKLKPVRMAVDVQGMLLTGKLRKMIEAVRPNDPYISSIKVVQNTSDTIRINIDFKVDVDPQVFSLKPFGEYRYRLVFDIYPAQQRDPLMAIIQKEEKEKDVIGRLLTQVAEGQRRMEENRVESGAQSEDAIGDLIAGITSGTAVPMKPDIEPTPGKKQSAGKSTVSKPVSKPSKTPSGAAKSTGRKLVIAIDPGHGGEDPGAIGKTYRTREKDVVLSIARILQRELNALPGIEAVLTRSSDYFVPLNRRVMKARAAKADFFVSIHADAWIRSTARGSSVFCLNSRGKVSSQNSWLARRQNDADQIGGVNMRSQDRQIAKILMDMSFTAQVADSLEYGGMVLKEVGRINKLHKARVEQANFAVLKAPDIPSILVETAFLSNPQEEKNLRTAAFQKKMAHAIGNGILKAFNRKVRLG